MNHGRCLHHLGRIDEVEAPLLEAYEIFAATLKPDDQSMREIHQALAALYEATGRLDEAAPHRAAMRPPSSQQPPQGRD